jgi:hypothetical protein
MEPNALSPDIAGNPDLGRQLHESQLLGVAITCAQRVEYVLYGIVSHASHLPAGQKEKRFRNLTPEKFLRGDEGDLKATLGQLIEAFGDAFLIKTPDLIEFYSDRNLLAHDFVRVFRIGTRQAPPRKDAVDFLRAFIERAQSWEAILRGLLSELMEAAAIKEGRQAELKLSDEDRGRMQLYREHAARHLVASGKLGEGDEQPSEHDKNDPDLG